MNKIYPSPVRESFLNLVKQGQPAKAITQKLGITAIREANLIEELPLKERMDFCYNLLGSLHKRDISLALNMLPRKDVLRQIHLRLAENRFVHREALEYYVNASEVSKLQLYAALGINNKKNDCPDAFQAVCEALTCGEDQIQSSTRFSKGAIKDVHALLPELDPKSGSYFLLHFPQAKLPAETSWFIEKAVDRLISEDQIDQDELEIFSKGNLSARLISAKHRLTKKEDLIELSCDRRELVASAAYRNLRERSLIDDKGRLYLAKKAQFWWVRRELIVDPETKADAIQELADRYMKILVKILRREVKRGFVPGISSPKVIPDRFPSLDHILILLTKLELYEYPHEAKELAVRINPEFDEFSREFTSRIMREIDLLHQSGRMPM